MTTKSIQAVPLSADSGAKNARCTKAGCTTKPVVEFVAVYDGEPEFAFNACQDHEGEVRESMGPESVDFTRESMLTGEVHTRELPLSPAELERFLVDRAVGAAPHVQVAFPALSADDREFIVSGATPEEWETAFGPLADRD
ncbi:hypothetical protein SEA_LILYPAD_38 [Gordonia phage LilyPad]|nr:hypothetical protein SEA_LILYPAD_38 [Gordonia phage LilyPad]